MDWWTQNKDAIIAIVAILGAIGSIAVTIWAAIKWGFLRQWQKGLRVDVKVFEVISDPAILLPKLYATENDNSPLADHNIRYQPRDPDRDLQGNLKTALNRSRYLLITAPTGYGKTREAGVLAQTMMLEGWRVLLIRNTGWLDVPKTLPAELNNNRSRVLIFLDDINGLFSTGERTQSPRAEQIPMLNEPSYHDRLLQVLNLLEGMCTEKEIRVIATARSEADQWKILNYSEKDKLWKRFVRVEIAEPADVTIIDLLEDTTKQVNLHANVDDFKDIAHKSDGTYRNIILNLRRLHALNQALTKDSFKDTLNGSWQEVYEQALKKHPAIKYIYDAIDILQQIELDPFRFLVRQAALLLWGGDGLKKIIRQAQIDRALDYITTESRIMREVEYILRPSDGQIEAKPTKTDWHNYALLLQELIFEKTSGNLSQLLTEVLFSFGMHRLEVGDKEDALKVWNLIPSHKIFVFFDRIMSLSQDNRIPAFRNTIIHTLKEMPRPDSLEFLSGIILEGLEKYTEADSVYRRCLSQNPKDAFIHVKLGDVLRFSDRYAEAEEAYRQAIKNDPNYADAYSRIGSLYRKLRRYSDAEINYRKAITLDPNNFNAAFIYLRHGEMLSELKRYREAENAFRQAILKDPNYADAYFRLGILLQGSGKTKEANESLKKVIELESEIPEPKTYFRIVSLSKQLGEEIPPLYVDNARQSIAEDDWYNLACIESICGNFDVAFENLRKAAKRDQFNPGWAWEDPDLQWIRDDPRFMEIVGSKAEK